MVKQSEIGVNGSLQREIVLDSLQSNREYKVRVSMRNKIGNGSFSEEYIAQTAEISEKYPINSASESSTHPRMKCIHLKHS
ncbi:hypothetical protein B4U80_14821 [Leptotrombidium deliense]|uniref:Fibronectin type-III domain-containing protein n=1 Tax=Leptotrombidium deliense TaxID=299467 RepID=A0A443Q9B7_9ACAR|nr:hypothetical protein B4U80_14821 [Leptotrombidium deliense]